MGRYFLFCACLVAAWSTESYASPGSQANEITDALYDLLQSQGGSTGGGDNGGGEAASFSAFKADISTPVIQTECVICHISGGVAGNSDLLYKQQDEAGYEQHNYDVLKAFITKKAGNGDVLLANTRGELGHEGGNLFSPPDAEYSDLENFVNLVESGK